MPIGDWFNRTLFAAKFAERNILFSRAISAESKLILYRNPKERVQRVAPWLTTDANTYPAVVNGRNFWRVAATDLDCIACQRHPEGCDTEEEPRADRDAGSDEEPRDVLLRHPDQLDRHVSSLLVGRSVITMRFMRSRLPG